MDKLANSAMPIQQFLTTILHLILISLIDLFENSLVKQMFTPLTKNTYYLFLQVNKWQHFNEFFPHVVVFNLEFYCVSHPNV